MDFQARVERALASLPEKPPVQSLPHLLEPIEQGLTVGLPGRSAETTQLALKLLERRQPIDGLVSADHSAAQVVALLPNVGAPRIQEVIAAARAAARDVPPGCRATVTGNLVITAHVTDLLTQRLLGGLAAALVVSLVGFGLALRDVRLALIGLVLTLLPVIVVFASMPLLSIRLTPSTVIITSLALVIADDATLQALLRFRRRHLALQAEGAADAHQRAALDTLGECVRAMLVTTVVVTAGFLMLLLSRLDGIANLGLLTGLTLWVAGLANAFLTPVLLIKLQPSTVGRSR
jgi:predicted RND superfamily exporter protein